MQRQYEILRFIQQNEQYHVSIDYILGESLGEYILKHPNVPKSKLWKWIRQLLKELQAFEQVQEFQTYGYLTPFTVIIKPDEGIALLNLKSDTNKNRLNQILSWQGISLFFKPNAEHSDIYSFGKTLQFLLAKTNLSLKRYEKSTLQKIISKCISKTNQYSKFQEISFQFSKRSPYIFLTLCVILFLGIVCYYISFQNTEPTIEQEIAYMKACYQQGTSDSRQELLRIGEALKQDFFPVYELMASAYQQENQNEQALQEYRQLNIYDFSEELYQTMIHLYMQENSFAQALELCRQGMDKNPKSVGLQALYVQVVCLDGELSQEDKILLLEKLLKENPSFQFHSQFKKLQKEFAIQMEGEKICFTNS